MAYIDAEYFNEYTSTIIPADEFSVLAARASDVIDVLTRYRIGGTDGFAKLPAFTQEQIKRATAAEIETIYAQGGLSAITGDGVIGGGVTIGKFSYTSGAVSQNDALQTINGLPVSPLLNGYLWPTGLLYAGVRHV